MRLRLVQSVAHGINNPLNYISLGTQTIKPKLRNLIASTKALLGEELSEDKAIRAIQENYSKVFQDSEFGLDTIESGLKKAEQEVVAIRSLNLVDGYDLKPINFDELRGMIRTSLRDSIPPEEYARIDFDRFGKGSFEEVLQSNLFVLKRCFEQFLITVLNESSGPVAAIWYDTVQGDFGVICESCVRKSSMASRALAICLTNLLQPIYLSPHLELREGSIVLRIKRLPMSASI